MDLNLVPSPNASILLAESNTTESMTMTTTMTSLMTSLNTTSSRYPSSSSSSAGGNSTASFPTLFPGTSTEGSGSDWSSFEEFCGNSPFWDTDLLLDGSYPRFTECFQQVAVAWMPCMLYIVACAPYLLYLTTRPSVPSATMGIASAAKMACTVILIIVSMTTIIVRATYDDDDVAPDAVYVSEGLKIASFLVHMLVCYVERQKGVVASPVSWAFWLVLFILNIIPFYSNIEENKDDSDAFGFTIFIVYAILVLAALLIASFAETRDEDKYADLDFTINPGNPSPEHDVSIPNRLSFWWMTSMVIAGFKRTLEEKDAYDLQEQDKCGRLTAVFMDTWDKEKIKVEKYNSTVRAAPKKSPAQNGASKKGLNPTPLDEKTPLLGNGASKSETTTADGEKDSGKKTMKKKRKGEEEEKSPYKSVSVVKVLMIDHGLLLLGTVVLKTGFDMFVFLNPKITEALLDYINNKNEYHEWRGYALAGCYLAVNAFTSIGSNTVTFYTRRISLHVRVCLVNAIYRKSLTVANIGKETSKGEIENLVSVDCSRIEFLANYIYLIISAPAQIALAIYLLYEKLGVALFAGMAVFFVMIPVNVFLGSVHQRWQRVKMKYKDDRNKLLNEMLNGIKVLKLYAWEKSFQEKVEVIRKQEIRVIRNSSYLIALMVFFLVLLPNLVRVIAFAVYIDRHDYLGVSMTFVSLQLFTLLAMPLNMMSFFIPMFNQTAVALKRISQFLNLPDIQKDCVRINKSAVNAVEIKNGTFTWSPDAPLPTLRNIEMEIAPGSLVAFVGTVGSGKSSLVSAILGEMDRLSGTVTIKGSTAYVPQEAWIQNATLRDNVTFGKDLHQKTYDRIIEACALKADLTILPGGDKTEIGEKGINISGGQKQRVSLARAVYSDKDIFLLDDPLSAVDSHVGKHIFKEVVGNNGMLRKKTRILVTHGVQWLPLVDKIFVVANGEIRESGNYDDLVEKNGDFARFIKEYAATDNDGDDNGGGGDVSGDRGENDQPIDTSAADELQSFLTDPAAMSDSSIEMGRSQSLRKRRKSVGEGGKSKRHQRQPPPPPSARRQNSIRRQSSLWDEDSNMLTTSGKLLGLEESVSSARLGGKLVELETGATGRVKFGIYLYYLKQLGVQMSLLSVFLYLISSASTIFAGIWLTEWTSDSYLLNRSNVVNDKFDDKTQEYLGVYAAANMGQGIFIFIFSLLFALKSSQASLTLHQNVLVNVLRSPMSFFDTTPLGRITNRFTNDIATLDNMLPMSLRQMMRMFNQLLITIFNICWATPIFIVALLPLSVIYVFIQVVYLPTCRQLRRITSITGSPILSHFKETLGGTVSIRAYGCQERFIQESIRRVDYNNKFHFATSALSSWLSFRLQFLGNMVIFAAAMFAVTASDIDASIVGLSVSYATSMTSSLEQLVNSITQCETDIVAVERLKEYTISPQEAPWSVAYQPRTDWPDEGNVLFQEYETRYRPGLDLVLRDLTCTIKGGEKIGIVGRTGAGKSSMTVALFRIIESAGGKITIDGEDIARLGLHDLRNKITILPQEPVIFSGTLRMNLDPFSKYSEPELWNALEHSYLKDFVESLPAGLEYQCGQEGANLSVGQRQLVCLARTLLRKTKILVLDEATAAVDMETDDLIQRTIRTEFKSCTVLTIAHRLNTIMDYDRVMVLDQGSIKEFDSPSALLADENSIFHGMARDAGIV